MMIAFITIKSSLVPLIEGLCAQIYFIVKAKGEDPDTPDYLRGDRVR